MHPWDEYDYWQWSADGNNRGYEFGVESDDIDLNRKNGYAEDPVEDPHTFTVIAEEGDIVDVRYE